MLFIKLTANRNNRKKNTGIPTQENDKAPEKNNPIVRIERYPGMVIAPTYTYWSIH